MLFRVKMFMDKSDTKKIGKIGEDIACQFLIRKGFRILDRNYRKEYGEIDIVAEKSGIVRFVEVKTVSRENIESESKEGYRPEEQVHPKKLRKIASTGAVYVDENNITSDYQIDVIGVLLNTEKRVAKCRLFEGATF